MLKPLPLLASSILDKITKQSKINFQITYLHRFYDTAHKNSNTSIE